MEYLIWLMGGFSLCLLMFSGLVVSLIKSNTRLIEQNTQTMKMIGDMMDLYDPIPSGCGPIGETE